MCLLQCKNYLAYCTVSSGRVPCPLTSPNPPPSPRRGTNLINFQMIFPRPSDFLEIVFRIHATLASFAENFLDSSFSLPLAKYKDHGIFRRAVTRVHGKWQCFTSFCKESLILCIVYGVGCVRVQCVHTVNGRRVSTTLRRFLCAFVSALWIALEYLATTWDTLINRNFQW